MRSAASAGLVVGIDVVMPPFGRKRRLRCAAVVGALRS